MRMQTAILKQEIEAKLVNRIPAALSPMAQQAPRLQTTGNARLDALIEGGLPLGSVCELTGSDSSGRSSIALNLLAHASIEAACAYIDVSDMLSPQSAAAARVQLANLLWVRFAIPAQPAAAVEGVRGLAVTMPPNATQQRSSSSHPRGEAKGLAPALEQMLAVKEEHRRRKMEGTPGYANQPLGLSVASQDQVEWEQFNRRKVDERDPLRRLDREAAEAARRHAAPQLPASSVRGNSRKPWDRLDRALRATDQILQSGGFRVVVLDLASIAPEQALRIPSATWFRFRRAAQSGDSILLLLTREPCARSSAACVIECSSAGVPRIQGVLTGATHTAAIARQRTGPAYGKKAPGRVTSWDAAPAWMRAAGR